MNTSVAIDVLKTMGAILGLIAGIILSIGIIYKNVFMSGFKKLQEEINEPLVERLDKVEAALTEHAASQKRIEEKLNEHCDFVRDYVKKGRRQSV